MSDIKPSPEFTVALEAPNTIPKDKQPATATLPGYGSGIPAVNTGAIEIKCVINRKCPFVKSPYMHDVLVFNAQSLQDFPIEVQDQFATIEGAEGIFLPPKHQYRHTFIAAPPVADIAEDATDVGRGKKIIELSKPRGVFGSSMPTYERFQRFIIQPSVFDTTFLSPDKYGEAARTSSTTCTELAQWQYEVVTPERVSPDSNSTSILMPKQIAGTTCNGRGVHWRVLKQTPLFQGQDFFVEFHRRSRATDVPQAIKDEDNPFKNQPFKIKKYAPLDVLNQTPITQVDGCGNTYILRKNAGVCNYTDGNEDVRDEKMYDFRDQAYYVIELGYGGVKPDSKPSTSSTASGAATTGATSSSSAADEEVSQNYFIIITERGNPICVRMDGDRSYRVAEYPKRCDATSNIENPASRISGKQIIQSPWCRVTVRNHLGDLAITFEGPNFKSAPWVISRFDTVTEPSSKTGLDKVYQKAQKMVVTRAPLSIWGGNMNSGFIFGILEYEQGKDTKDTPVKFTCPPQTAQQKGSRVCSTDGGSGGFTVTTGDASTLTADKRQNSLALPLFTTHSILLTATDYDLEETGDKAFFTQDAQLYSFVKEGSVASVPGTFFKSLSLKEVQDKRQSEIRVEKRAGVQDEAARMELFQIDVILKAGSHEFTDGDGGFQDTNGSPKWEVKNCKTPVLTMIRLVATPKAELSRWETTPRDVSEHVLEFHDAWSAQDFFKIDHTGTIKFLVNPGARYRNNQTEFLMSLLDKAFYIEVWARYIQMNDNNNTPVSPVNGCNYSKLNGYYKLFTGVCYGGSVSLDMGQRIMECQIYDYSKVLQDMMFFNAPFYDGVRDVVAVYEILRMAGFKEKANDDPGVLLKRFAGFKDGQMHFGIGPDGRLVPVAAYALPNAYNKLSQPYYKFGDGDSFHSGIMKIAQKAGKCFFFDSHGVAHFESYFDFAVLGVMSGIDNELLGGEKPTCVDGKLVGGSSSVDPESLALWWYTTNPDAWRGQMIYDTIRFQRAVGDVYNHVKIMGNTPDFEVFFLDDVDWSSIDDPTQEGFLGYIKSVLQKESIFGSPEAARNVMNFYKAMRRPPLILNFQTYGQPVRALDTVIVCGQPARVMKVDASIIPKENRWWNSFECEWLYPTKEGLVSLACSPSSTPPSGT